MVTFASIATVLVIAYLLGSIPTALILSKRIKRIDIRTVGDGNMGARNTFHEIGPKFGVLVAVIDFSKGALSVFLAYILGLNLGWQILTAVFSILGHEFAHLKGRDSLSLFVLSISEYLFRVYVFFPFLLSLPLSYSAFFSLYYLYLPLSLGAVYFIGKFFEARADLESAVKVGMPKILAEALRKIGFRRLQFEERNPIYRVQAWFAWDPHPPLYYRIARLERMETPVTVRHTFIQSVKDVLGGFAEALGIRAKK